MIKSVGEIVTIKGNWKYGAIVAFVTMLTFGAFFVVGGEAGRKLATETERQDIYLIRCWSGDSLILDLITKDVQVSNGGIQLDFAGDPMEVVGLACFVLKLRPPEGEDDVVPPKAENFLRGRLFQKN